MKVKKSPTVDKNIFFTFNCLQTGNTMEFFTKEEKVNIMKYNT